MALFPLDQIVTVLADAYGAAARLNADMRAATNSLETVRATLAGERDAFTILSVLDEHVGRAESDRLQPALAKLRDYFEQEITGKEISKLDEALRQDAAAGWNEWLQIYARALSEWRLTFCLALANAPLPFPTEIDPSIEQIKHYTKCLMHQRWAETGDWFLFLAQQDIPPERQAKLLVSAGEVEIYHLLKPDNAKKLFEQAEQLAAEEVRVQIGWSEYWRQQPDLEEALDKAKEFAQRAVEIAPDREDGYVALGECYEKEGNLDAAEQQYQHAILSASGTGVGYLQLIRLYGRRERYSTHKDRVPGLIKRLLAIYPPAEYALYLEEGAIYQQNKLYADAHNHYEKAINLDRTRLGGYTADAYAYLEEADEAQQDKAKGEVYFGKARANFEQAIAVAPESFDGYWGMAWVCERQELWEESLAWCERALPLRPEWESMIRVRMADMRRRLGQFKQAEEELERAFQLEPQNQQALDILTALAEDYYKKGDDTESALRIYDAARQRQGAEFETTYYNLVGHLKFYYRDYQAAAEAYRQASALNPKEAVYYSNLALALERMPISDDRAAILEQATVALNRAQELAPDDKEYIQRLEGLKRQRSFLERYGEEALKFKLLPTPVRVLVQIPFLPYILSESRENLSDEMARRLKEMRERIRQEYGLPLPPAQFSDFQEDGAQPGTYRFTLMEEQKAEGVVLLGMKFTRASQDKLAALEIKGEPAQPGVEGYWIAESSWAKAVENGIELWNAGEYLTRHLEFVLKQNLVTFLNYQETVNLLAACATEECTEIIDSPPKVLGLIYSLKAFLQKHKPITDLQSISKDFLALYRDKIEAQISGERSSDTTGADKPISDTASLKLFIGKSFVEASERPMFQEVSGIMQEQVFNALGVICPKLLIEDDESLPGDAFRLEINNRRLEPIPGWEPDEFMLNCPVSQLGELGLTGRATVEPISKAEASIVRGDEEVLKKLQQDGFVTKTYLDYALLNVAAAITDNVGELLSAELIHYYLSVVQPSHPALVEAINKQYDTSALIRQLRRIVEARASIKNLPFVLEYVMSADIYGRFS